MKKRNWFFQAAGCAAVAFVFLLPLFRLALMSVTQNAGYGFGNYLELFREPRTLRAIGNTVAISVASTALSAVFGVLLAFLVAYLNIKRKRLLELLALAPFILPSYVVTISWTSLLEQNGGANRLLQLLHLPAISL